MGENGDSSGQTRDHISVDIAREDWDLVASIRRNLEAIPLSRFICKVPEKLCAENQGVYSPRLVSIGPLHHGEHALKKMEHHKWRYLNAILNRKPNLEAILDSCVDALKELEQRARSCYGEKIHFESNDFVTMMLVDGCFIIELFLKIAIRSSKRIDDPLLNTTANLNILRSDMMLLENQIPFFVLQRLFYIVPIPKQCSQTLTELALRFFKIMIPGNIQDLQEKFSLEGHHLLDLVRSCYLPTYSKLQPSDAQKNLDCATKLQEAGIKLRRAPDESLLSIRFVSGVLLIPPLKIQNHTEIVMRNLIALEQCSCDCTNFITSYAFLMKSLIQSKEDVKFLHRRGILINSLDKQEEVSALFNKLCKDVDLQDSYYKWLCQQVNEYRRGKRRIWRQKLKFSYRKTPLIVAGSVLAILFIIVTFAGTLFSVLSFLLHHS